MDEQVPTAVTRGLRARGVDVVTARESSLLAASDEEHLDRAAAEGRVIFTQQLISCVFMPRGVATPGLSTPTSRARLGT